ncbi:hypothetical protein [Microbacterium sp. USHLN186]|uniref:hypothetical protein n=1 Tax=Microbacterium sp. USHLN186 TaxID=3081286 RepID=UPI003017D2DF
MTTGSRLVAPSEDVGSPELTAALRIADPASISSALAQGWVVVPLLRTSQGSRIRLIEGLQGRTGWELPVFSSVAALHSFLAGDEQRDFDFIPGTALAGLLAGAEDRVARVVFDVSEPHAMAASVRDIQRLLSDTPPPPEVPRGLRPSDRAVDLDLPLGDDWFRLSLTEPAELEQRIRALVDRQLAGSDAGITLRVQLQQWLRRMARTAAGGGGRETAFLVRRTGQAALALSVTRYWHRLSSTATPHLDAIAHRLSSHPADADVVQARLETGRLIRHVRVTRDRTVSEGSGTPVLAADYWLEFPDQRGLCLVAFSTPHVDQQAAILALTDEILLASTWVIAASQEASA